MLLWDPKAARITFTVVVVTAAVYGVYMIRRTVFIFILGVFFAYMVYPLVLLLDRYRPRRAPRWASPVAALVLVVTAVILVAALIGPAIADEANRLSDQLPALLERGNAVESWPWPKFLQPYAERIVAFGREQLQGGAAEALPLARRLGAGVLQAAGDLLLVVLIPVLAFLLILSGPRIRDTAARYLSGSVWQRIVSDLDQLLGRYIRALLLLSVAAFVAYAVFLSIVAAPYALLLAAVAALLEFIPVFGPLVAGIAMLVVAGLASYAHLLWILIFVAAYRVFQDYILGPRLMGTGVGISPILVLFGLLAGEELAGVAGTFISVPVLAAAIIVGRHLMDGRHRVPEAH